MVSVTSWLNLQDDKTSTVDNFIDVAGYIRWILTVHVERDINRYGKRQIMDRDEV